MTCAPSRSFDLGNVDGPYVVWPRFFAHSSFTLRSHEAVACLVRWVQFWTKFSTGLWKRGYGLHVTFPEPFHRWRPHPWHGLSLGPDYPVVTDAFIEITPFDLVKYEIDKINGYLRVDRPQRTSSQPPALYGFFPQTFCGRRTAALMEGATKGDGDPLDVCVLSERPIDRAGVIVRARIVGGLPMLDDGEADDKIVAVLENDPVWGNARELQDLPSALIDRLRHYFLTYKLTPGQTGHVSISETYSRDYAYKVLEAAVADYNERYGNV